MSLESRTFRRPLALLALLLVATGCRPKAKPLEGATIPARRLPATALPPGHRTTVFRWELQDAELRARGDGAVRAASPDSARLDLFLEGGLGSAIAVLIDDELRVPGGAMLADRIVPPPPLLWGALGRVALPAGDTTVVARGDTVVGDIRAGANTWRAHFIGPRLTRLERITDGRIAEFVDRRTPDRVRYEVPGTRRVLTLLIQREFASPPFDAEIWRP